MKLFTKSFGLIALFSLGLMLTMPSCKDECKDVTCLNGGECNEDNGNCDCPLGFSGTQCEVEDKCITGDVQCVNGNCNSTTGLCECKKGWVGDLCEVEDRADWIAIWKYTDNCVVANDEIYDITISRPSSNNDAEILINNLMDRGLAVTGVVDGLTVTIESQQLDSETTAEGTGTLILTTDPWTISFDMSYTDALGTDMCSGIGFKLN